MVKKAKVKRKYTKKGKAGVTSEPVLSKISQSEALLHFKAATGEWQRASLALVISGAICLITGTHSKDRVDVDTTILKMKAEIAERGIKEAQSYKYLGLTRYFVSHMAAKFPAHGPIIDVTNAPTWEKAADVLRAYLEKMRVRTLDDLGVLVGRYQRTKRKGSDSPNLVPEQQGGNVVALPSRATPQAIIQRLKAQPDLLAGMKPQEFAPICVKGGRAPAEMIQAFIPLISSVRDCNKLEKALKHHAEALRNGQVEKMALTG